MSGELEALFQRAKRLGFSTRVLNHVSWLALILAGFSFALYISDRALRVIIGGLEALLSLLMRTSQSLTEIVVLAILATAVVFMVSRWLSYRLLIAVFGGALGLRFMGYMFGVLANYIGSSLSDFLPGIVGPPRPLPRIAELIYSGVILALYVLSLLGRALVGWASANLPALLGMTGVMSGIAALAMRLDKTQAELNALIKRESILMGRDPERYEGWRLPEASIKRYAVVGGGPGVLASAFIFRHKTLHTGLLAEVAAYTSVTIVVLALGVMGA